jgi:hypothetical protein
MLVHVWTGNNVFNIKETLENHFCISLIIVDFSCPINIIVVNYSWPVRE